MVLQVYNMHSRFSSTFVTDNPSFGPIRLRYWIGYAPLSLVAWKVDQATKRKGGWKTQQLAIHQFSRHGDSTLISRDRQRPQRPITELLRSTSHQTFKLATSGGSATETLRRPLLWRSSLLRTWFFQASLRIIEFVMVAGSMLKPAIPEHLLSTSRYHVNMSSKPLQQTDDSIQAEDAGKWRREGFVSDTTAPLRTTGMRKL